MSAYLILDFTIRDLDAFQEYIRKIPAHIEKHHGRYIVQGEVPTILEGDWRPDRIVVIEFPTSDTAKEFLQDPEAQSLFELRHRTTTSKLVLVDGCT